MSSEAKRRYPSPLFIWGLFFLALALLLGEFFLGTDLQWLALGCAGIGVTLALVYLARSLREERRD